MSNTQEEVLYVMRYADGTWVHRDDSTGPMSTGGYPMKVKELSRATQWTSKEDAMKYRYTCRSDGPWSLHRLELNTVPEVITPAMEAEASDDPDFRRFQELAKKYGVTGTGECPFVRSWIGKCKQPPEVGELYCEDHKNLTCWKCHGQATSDCSHTSQFVCGYPQCDEHPHHG